MSDRTAELLAAATLNRGVPLREQIHALVRKTIVTGKLPPGAPVNEIEIATRLGTSRSPVREAVRKLSDEGLIDVLAQNGTFVSRIHRAQVEEAYIIRIALEMESVSRAAFRINAAGVDDLTDIVRAQETALARARYDEAIDRDDGFHRSIAQVSGLSMLWKVVDVSKAQMDRCRMLSLPTPGAGQQTIAQHRAILGALAAGDAEASVAAMRTHLQTSLANSLSRLAAVTGDGGAIARTTGEDGA